MNLLTLIPPGIAAFAFLVMGIVCWSYRDVYKRHDLPGAAHDETSGHDAHAGH